MFKTGFSVVSQIPYQITMIWYSYKYLKSKVLTHKGLEMHGWILSIVATDALVLKHQGISIHSAHKISIALDQF